MKKFKSNHETLDQLSELPDSLLHQILSFLEMRDVVATTLLSKRWKYLWTTTPCLRFKENGDSVEIRNFVTRALSLWRGTHLRKFTLSFKCEYDDDGESLSDDVDLWVLFAKQRKAEVLFIRFDYGGPLYCPPQCLYQCSSIRKLSLIGCNLYIRGNMKWDCLNSLKLSGCHFSDDVINQVFSSSPQLETFTHICRKGSQNLSIRSSCLKNLSICSRYKSSDLMSIWAPNLEALKFSGCLYSKCLLTDVSSLTEVNLDVRGYGDPKEGEALCQILAAIRHAVSVELSDSCFEMLAGMKGKYPFSPLLNVKLLRIDRGLTELKELVWLLEIFPKLKTLSIEWKLDHKEDIGEPCNFIAENYIMPQENILKSNLLQLRTIEISWFSYEASILQFIEFLLEHATMIEKMVIRRKKLVDSEDMFLVAQKVVSLQRSFPSAELILC